MKKYPLQIALFGALAAISVTGCSLLRKEQASTVNSTDAMPLYPVTANTYAEQSLDGHWFIRTVGSVKLSGYEDEEWPFIEFVPAEGRFYGNNGCNIINGSYKVGSAQTLTLSHVATTLMLCQGDTLEFPIARAIDAVRSFSVTTEANGSTLLSLHNDKNLTVMTLRKSDIDFLNGAWKVASINGKTVDNPDCRLVFDTAEGTVHGDTGCNILNGQLTRELQVSGSIGFSNLATTRRMCPDIQTEQSLLIALEEVKSARKTDAGVDLLDAQGQTLIRLTKLAKEDIR